MVSNLITYKRKNIQKLTTSTKIQNFVFFLLNNAKRSCKKKIIKEKILIALKNYCNVVGVMILQLFFK